MTSTGTSPLTHSLTHSVLKQSINQSIRRGRIQRTFDLPFRDPDLEDLLQKETDLLRLESRSGWSTADLCRAAWKEYVIRHHPGNSQLPLSNFDSVAPEPLSISAQEKVAESNGFPVCPGCGKMLSSHPKTPGDCFCNIGCVEEFGRKQRQ